MRERAADPTPATDRQGFPGSEWERLKCADLSTGDTTQQSFWELYDLPGTPAFDNCAEEAPALPPEMVEQLKAAVREAQENENYVDFRETLGTKLYVFFPPLLRLEGGLIS